MRSHPPSVGERLERIGQNYPLPKRHIDSLYWTPPPLFLGNSIMSFIVSSQSLSSRPSQLSVWNNGMILRKFWGFFYRWQQIGNNGYFWPREWNRQTILGALLRTCSSTWAAYCFGRKYVCIYVCVCVCSVRIGWYKWRFHLAHI